MTSKFAIKSILAVSSVLTLSVISTPVWAPLSPQSTSQTSCTLANRLKGLCSIETLGVLKGLGNVTNSPTIYRVSVLVKQGTVAFQNPTGKSGGVTGVPFGNVSVAVSLDDFIDANQVTKNGRALGVITFHDDELVNAILAGLEDACSKGVPLTCDQLKEIHAQLNGHPNWIKWAVITELHVLGEQWVDESQSCDLSGGNVTNCTLEDALGQKCNAPQAVKDNPLNFIGQQFDYQCQEACNNPTTPCPPSFPLPG